MPLGFGCLKTSEDLWFKAGFLKPQVLGLIFKGKTQTQTLERYPF